MFDEHSLKQIPKYISEGIEFNNCDFSGNVLTFASNRTFKSVSITNCHNIKKINLNCVVTSDIDIMLENYVPFRIAHGEKLKLGHGNCYIEFNNIPNKVDMNLHNIPTLWFKFGMPDFTFMSTSISNVTDCNISLNKNNTSFRNIETFSGVETTTISLWSQSSYAPHNIIIFIFQILYK